MKTYKNSDFREMFTVDPNIRNLKVGEDSIEGFQNIPLENDFNIPNGQIKDKTGATVDDLPRLKYFENVAYLLYDKIPTSQIHNFLNYHYNNATNKQGFIGFIKFDIWDFAVLQKIAPQRKEILQKWDPNEIEKPNAIITSICAYFLAESGYIIHESTKELSEKAVKILYSDWKASTIKKYVNTIKSKNISDILTPVNLQTAIPFLSKYPKAQKKAQKHLDTIDFS